MKIKELKQRQADARTAARKLLDTAEAEKRDLTAEESTAFDAHKATIESTASAIKREEFLESEEIAAAQASRLADLRTPRSSGMTDLEVAKPWAQLHEFFDAVRVASNGYVDKRLFAGTPQGMNQNVPSEGGFLVPPEISTLIWNRMSEDPAALLPMMDNYTVTGESLSFNANAETSRVAGQLYGGVVAYWIAEADQFTKSKPKFRQIKVEPQELVALTYATEKLLANAGPSLVQWIGKAAGGAINHLINQALIEGNGAGQPLGLLNAPCVVSVAKETNQAAATIVQENISKMWARLHPLARQTAVWLHNVDIEPQLDFLNTVVKNQAGTENVGGYQNKVWDAERRTLKGRPLVPAEFCATLGTVGDLILVDPKSYVVGTRGALDSQMSMHVRFEYAETAFRFKFAVDGQPWLGSAITPAKGSNTLSTIITLATRA